MKRTQKWLIGISFAAMIGGVLWIRELASWRPVTVAKVGFSLDEIRVSSDGQWLVVRNQQGRGAVVNLQNGDFDSTSDEVRAFDRKHGTETFPRVWMKEGDTQPSFSPAPQRDILLSGISPTSGMSSLNDRTLAFPTGWSKARHEVYCAIRGVIWICDWTTGKLKKQFRYTKSINRNTMFPSKSGVFSPDGKWLLAIEETSLVSRLRRYNVQTGKLAPLPENYLSITHLEFSSDGKRLLVEYHHGGMMTLLNTSTWKHIWRNRSSWGAHFASDERIGCLGFAWIEAKSGAWLQRLPGPIQDAQAWTLSPHGNWIYAAYQNGFIRRWRAR